MRNVKNIKSVPKSTTQKLEAAAAEATKKGAEGEVERERERRRVLIKE